MKSWLKAQHSESKEELKSLMVKVKEESEKAGLKLYIHKTKIMASNPITSWQIDGKTDWVQIRKGVRQGCILSPCLLNLYAEYIMRNAGGRNTSWNQDCREKYQ